MNTARNRKKPPRLGEKPRSAPGLPAPVTEDVTERLQTEQVLHSREASYRQFFESVNDAIFLRPVTPDGLGACFAEVNGVACKWLGYTPEELRQKSRLEIDPDSTAAQIEARDKQVLAQGSAIFETRFLTKTGRRMPVEISSRLFEWGAAPWCFPLLVISPRAGRRRRRSKNPGTASERCWKTSRFSP